MVRNYKTPGVKRSLKKTAKYRAQLNKIRRQKGIYGKGGDDVSHNEDGTYNIENKSANRSRNGENGKGTKAKRRGVKIPALRKKPGRPPKS